jgi:hypothetical protein
LEIIVEAATVKVYTVQDLLTRILILCIPTFPCTYAYSAQVLRAALKESKLSATGSKPKLAERFIEHIRSQREGEDDDDDDDDEDVDEPPISAGGGQQQDDGDDDDDDEGAQEHIDFEAKFKWLGPICRKSAQFPPHCLHLPCLREMTQSIRTRYPNMQITGLEATPSEPPHDDPAFQDRARQMRSEFDNANPNTTKTYKQLGTLFLIYCFFFSESFDPMQPLFTRLHAGLFLNKFIHRPKQLRSRGAIGNTITTKSMIARLSMVLNGFFKYEREITGAILRARELAPGAAGFFDGEIEVTKPCSKNNPLWRAANRVHTGGLSKSPRL